MLLNKKISIWYFIKGIGSQLVIITVFAVAVGLLDELPVFRKASLPLAVPALLGTAVSLLLGFRTAQSYERWWEARTVWGAIVNDSRTLIRQIQQFVPEKQKVVVREFALTQITWVYALGEALRRQEFSPKVKSYMDAHQLQATNIPNAILDRHSDKVKELASESLISDFKQVQLNETLARLCDSMGRCERIKNTVFPRSYSLLVHTLIYVFAILLPLGMQDVNVGIEIFLTILIPILFVAIEKTAIIMQDPFENTPVDTPMTALAQTIEINLLEMIGEREVPAKPKNDQYFEM